MIASYTQALQSFPYVQSGSSRAVSVATLFHSIAIGLACFPVWTIAAPPSPVAFDAPAIVIAEPIDPINAQQPTAGGPLLRIRLPVSTLISPTFQGTVSEFVVQIESPQQSLRVVDFWPKTEVYSEIAGNIQVADQRQKDQNFAFNVSGAYEPFGRGTASGDFRNHENIQEQYQRRPPMQLLTSSGTIQRGYGVFYKFRPGNIPVLEGDREVALLVEAPRGWRGDLLQVSMRAVGYNANSLTSTRPHVLGDARMWVATHHSGDAEAADAARRFVSREQNVRYLANSSQQSIAERAAPTMFHKVGVALDVVEPKIPHDFLVQILFGVNPQYFNEATSRLPIDLRVAALDYWDERSHLLSMASR